MCSVGLVIMTIFTFVGVVSRKLPQVNLSWTMELVTTMFVWVCALAAAAAFKTNSHMGFAYLTDKLRGFPKIIHKWIRVAIIFGNYAIWILYGFKMVESQIKSGLVTPVMATPGWMIGLAIPVSAVLAVARILQYELGYRFGKKEREALR
ncbi:TRAP-type C4-dicarboxylate transport system, small permease component [Acetomicrobium mobile DSM 13181]|uniref:TRAP-type C4-dicarboxylate transport system, small permease component n=1 Tax=Acetomicrobium mobile (strain ATCC BAA-54 / DSM 13181 / JCM 12221 / NGA) TaxID=891968 RepID=I4BZA9_ACEMN|nr:TRAP-type C4-dicarboxylate transport system, small permease component [Acetomicrobium mobile DSM 13181]